MIYIVAIEGVENLQYCKTQKEPLQHIEISVAVLRLCAACQQVNRKQDHFCSSGQNATDQDSIFALCKILEFKMGTYSL